MNNLARLIVMLCTLAIGGQCCADISRAFDAVCRITRIDADGRARGTGTAISRDDRYVYVLTNAHVVGAAASVDLEFYRNGYKSPVYPGTVTLRDLHTWQSPEGYKMVSRDVAIVAVDLNVLPLVPRMIPLAKPHEVPRVSDVVLSIGCAKGHWPSMYRGHVIGRNGHLVRLVPQNEPGRSGSALLNADGTAVVGLLAWSAGFETEGDESDDSSLAMSIDEVRDSLAYKPAQQRPEAVRVSDDLVRSVQAKSPLLELSLLDPPLVPVVPKLDDSQQCGPQGCPPRLQLVPNAPPGFQYQLQNGRWHLVPLRQAPPQQQQPPLQQDPASPWLNPPPDERKEEPKTEQPPKAEPEKEQSPKDEPPPAAAAPKRPLPPPLYPENDESRRDSLADKALSAGESWLTVKGVALLVSIGAPGWLAALAVFVVKKRIAKSVNKRRANRAIDDDAGHQEQQPRADPQCEPVARRAKPKAAKALPHTCPEPEPIVLETPPPPQVIRTEQKYIQIEGPNREAEALRKAMAYYLERYPGSRGSIETIEHYARQFLSGKPASQVTHV